MLSRVFSASVSGVDAELVEVEVNTGFGERPGIVVVGLPDAAVRESRDRVETAIINSAFSTHPGKTTVNLAPADVRKEGPSFDLPIALGLLGATSQMRAEGLERWLVTGELALNGQVRPVCGVLPMALMAQKRGFQGIIVPEANAREAAVVRGITVHPVRSLKQAAEFLIGKENIAPISIEIESLLDSGGEYDVDFSEVKGQESVKRALEVAAAGSHNLLMIGPPGTGKSMLAKRIPSILPPMTLEEALETTKVHSVAGLLAPGRSIVTERPFRTSHHTISDIGLVGGSSSLRPGEVSLAHNGVLFLDELPEFKRQTLEILRQPLEDRRVTISRATGSVSYPCSFMLIAAMNPSPSGVRSAGTTATQKYLNRISRPLLDRFDIHCDVPTVKFGDLAQRTAGESSSVIRERVLAARRRQQRRFQDSPGVFSNAQMSSKHLKKFCQLPDETREMLRHAMDDLNFSARAHDRILKVARTIADLADSDEITADYISEAIQYRTLDRTLWQ